MRLTCDWWDWLLLCCLVWPVAQTGSTSEKPRLFQTHTVHILFVGPVSPRPYQLLHRLRDSEFYVPLLVRLNCACFLEKVKINSWFFKVYRFYRYTALSGLSDFSIHLFYDLAMPAAVWKGLSSQELVESRDEERARAELAACHREGTNSFHLKKMMELVFTGALLLFTAAVATIQQQVSLPRALRSLGNQTSWTQTVI